LGPASIGFEQSVCDDEDFTHNNCDGDLGWFSVCDELLALRLEVRVVSGCNEGGYEERMAHASALAANEADTFPLVRKEHDQRVTRATCS
jgi:hypothetical protein